MIEILFLVHFSVVMKAPWQVEVDRGTPWSGAKDRREEFFKNLQQDSPIFDRELSKNVQRHRAMRSQTPRASAEWKADGWGESLILAEEGFEKENLNELPWQGYQEAWSSAEPNTYIWPVSRGEISSGYGMRGGRLHEGLDIKAEEGSAIFAIQSGRVVFSSWIRGYGNTVVVYHGAGVSSVYAHNRENLVSKGQIVESGQRIANLGRTGKTTGSHLHFEIRKDGKAINPLKLSFQRHQQISRSER